MSDSLFIRLTDDWIRYARDWDVESMELIAAPAFTFYAVDENENVEKVERPEFFRRMKDQVKQAHTRADVRISFVRSVTSLIVVTRIQITIVKRDIKRADTVEVVAEVWSPCSYHLS